MSARHSAAAGGRGVSEILAQVAAGHSGAVAVAPARAIATTPIAAAAVVGAAAAAVGMTGTFPAIDAPTLADGGSSVGVVEAAATTAPTAGPASAARAAAVLPGAAAARPGGDAGGPVGSSARGGTVMAADLHQSDARDIAQLSHAVVPNRAAGPAAVPTSGPSGPSGLARSAAASGALGSMVDSALAMPTRLGRVPVSGVAANRSAATALRNAATRLGKPYVWGAEGPNAFDCSGLMQWAYKQAGVDIPRSSSSQARFGRSVPISQLKPGDMVFYYSPVSHVGMYLGNGKILHASEPGKPVKISPVGAFPIHNARRVA